MSNKSAHVHAPWDVDWENDPWENPRQTLQGNGMTFEELQKQYPHDYVSGGSREWKVMRTSNRGNRVMHGVCTKGYDNIDGCGGKAYFYDVTAIVRPSGEVVQYTIVYDEWDY